MNRARWLIVFILAVAGLGLLGFGLTRDPLAHSSPLVGGPAPHVRLAVMEPDDPRPGALWRPPDDFPDTVDLADLEGRIVILNFWASWCLACRQEHAALSSTADAYRDKDVRFFGVLYDDRPQNARRWIREMRGQSYPTLLDPDFRAAIDLGVYGVPETFVIDQAGRIADKHIGPITTEALRADIDSLLSMGTNEPDEVEQSEET